MKRISFLPISVIIMVLGLFSLGYSEGGIGVLEKRFALVIGNGSYKSSPLRIPTNDAHDMALVLMTLGFEVIHLENAEYRAMERAIRKFGKKLRNREVGLFYFAGHGIQVNGRNYLIPVDAEIETKSDVKFEAIDAGRVLSKMEDAGNDLNIVILDACRDNPFSRSFRFGTKGLARMDPPKGSIIAYATFPGSIAADGEGRNGIYTKYLLKYLIIPGLTIEQVFKKVRVEVLMETNSKQIPWESSSLTGDFHFNPAMIPRGSDYALPEKTVDTMPTFPWPPPAASAETVIPDKWLPTKGGAVLENVAVTLESALRASKYPMWSYSAVPNGFALVSRMEQIKADGTPSPDPARWNVDMPWVTNMTLIEFIKALINAPPGYYRVIVFIITNRPWPRTGEKPTGGEAEQWLARGFTWLPESIGGLPYGPDYRTTALVYEFKKVSKDASATLLSPSETSADDHLKKAGISEWLSRG